MHFFTEIFDALDQTELGAATIHVLLWIVGFEVGVALEVIGEEANAHHEGQEPGGENEFLHFGRNKEVGGVKITGDRGFEHLDVKVDAVGVRLRFIGGVASGPAQIAEVVEREPRHDGIQIHNGHATFALGVKERIVDFGVVVGDPFGDLPA